jgi:hypothetical protein
MEQKEYNNHITKINRLMSLESKVNIVGSASVRRVLWHADYDSFGIVRGKTVNKIYNHFKSLFQIIQNTENTVISDFKLGELKGEPLRWTYEHIKNKNNNGVSFEDALKQKGMIKLDVITLLNGRFIEISEVYNIYLDGESNYNSSKESILKELNNEFNELVKEGSHMKALKRFYSIKKLEDAESNRYLLRNLEDYFNSPIGLLNRCKSDLETMLIVINHSKFDLEEIRGSLQMIKEIVSSFPIQNNIENISRLKSKELMLGPLHKQILSLKRSINTDAQNNMHKFLR